MIWIFTMTVISASMIPAPSRARVMFAGNKYISSSVLQRWSVEIGPCPADELAQLVQQRCRRSGYFDAIVSVAGNTAISGNIKLQIDEGSPVTFGDVEVGFPSEFNGAFFRAHIENTFSGVAAADRLDRLLRQTVEELADSGYARARAMPEDFRRIDDKLDFSLFIDPGPRVRVGAWRITGLARTDSGRVRRLLELYTGAVWNREEQSRIQDRVRQLDYLHPSGDMKIASHVCDSLVIVEIPLAERPSVLADGGIGLAGGQVSGNRWQGRFDLSVENPFGGGRRLNLLISRLAQNTSLSRLGYLDPDIAASRIGISLDLEQSRESSAYDRFSLGFGGLLRMSRTTQFELRFQWSRFTPLSEHNGINAARRYDLSVAVGESMPGGRTSVYSRTTWHMGITASFRREYSGGETHNELAARARANASLTCHWRSGRHWGLRLRLSGESWIAPNRQLQWGDELYLGGPESIRGYGERTLTARGYVLTSLEAHYRPAARLGMYIFSDLAYLREFDLDDPNRQTRRAVGYGLGLETLNNLGRTRFELGWPEGAAFRDGVIYLRWLRGW